LAAGQLLESYFVKKKNFNVLFKKKKKSKKETLDRSVLSFIKDTTLGGPHVASWVGT